MEYLFSDNAGKRYSEDDVYSALYEVGAYDCDTLFLHSDVRLQKTSTGKNTSNPLQMR